MDWRSSAALQNDIQTLFERGNSHLTVGQGNESWT
jgi:hypothetical protein